MVKRTVSLVTFKGEYLTANTIATTLRGMLNALNVRHSPHAYVDSFDMVWDGDNLIGHITFEDN